MDRIRVFISSTQSDLQAERDCIESVVAELGYECLRAETLSAPGASPEQACKDMARACDIYIGVFGGQYGFVVPRLSCSATEMEYREARLSAPGKVLVYVKHAAEIDVEQSRFLAEVLDFSSGYFRHERFTDTLQLRGQLKRDLVAWTSRRIRDAVAKELEVKALRDKVAHLSRVMELYGIPEDLR